MVDSRAKGSRGETLARDKLRELTGLPWERVPGSGALDPKHKLKGDLYIPDSNNNYCVEVKNYAEDHFTSKILTDKTPQFSIWWEQTTREAKQVNKKPCLIFKFDRSKFFVAFEEDYNNIPLNYRWVYYSADNCFIMRLEDWIKVLEPVWV